MVGHGHDLDLERPKKMFFLRKTFSHLSFFLGMIVAYCTAIPQTPVKCQAKNISTRYEYCGAYQDGVRDLDCFGKHKLRAIIKDWNCVWTPGNHTSKKSFTLVVKQQRAKKIYCNKYDIIFGISQGISLYEASTMTAYVFDESDSRNCTKASFTGLPRNLVRCGPPYDVTLSRHVRELNVNVNWRNEDTKFIQKYSLRYKVLDSLSWSKSPVQSTDGNRCIVGNLNSSLAYEVQIQCVSSTKCPQCPWSEIYIVPPELTVQPVIVKVQDTDITEREGCRLLSLTWKFPARELVEGYNVNIQKASGEAPCVRMNTSRPEIRLILSSSAYLLSITAFNKASTSPAAVWTILPRGDMGVGAGRLNMTFNSNTSYTLSWKDDLIKSYSCYSVEWSRRGYKTEYMSFFEDQNNYKTILIKEPVEPYKRYNITLHVRPNKDTCNIKHVNNSECTYGSKQFYFIEGSPIGAPTNISSYNVTLNSMVLEWLPVPEEAVRGFLLGYTIHYNEYHQRGTYTETNITVDPVSNSYELGNLKSGTMYLVQISAFTHAGAGVRSATSYFETPSQGHLSVSTLTAFVVVTTVIICIILFGSLLLKRAKICFWPSIPNPGNSSAIQKIDGPYELELREPINTQKLEEWDTDSLQIIELSPTVTSYLTHDTEVERNSHSELSPDAPCVDQYQRDTGSTSGELSSGATADASSNMQQKDSQSSPFNFTSGYTTMELFQQAVPQSVAASITTVSQAAAHKPEETDSTVIRSELDYVRQFSTSPVNSSEECSTFI